MLWGGGGGGGHVSLAVYAILFGLNLTLLQ